MQFNTTSTLIFDLIEGEIALQRGHHDGDVTCHLLQMAAEPFEKTDFSFLQEGEEEFKYSLDKID